ncbi:hypothetical protein SASPL_144527 [Salvia splendens]|uniref:CRA domain-containing protein n=1 Tax=Salvia splendens TaxID=180675 RepID=A0A8X8WFF4_SALSN|nr:hypothetical protein SASPL_144527 [Salvia splendens]
MASPTKVITREEWEKRLSSLKPKKEDMNKLVMNFLVTEDFVEVAEGFQLETGTQLKKAVPSGNVEDAIEKVNDLNPEIYCHGFLGFVSKPYNLIFLSFRCRYWTQTPYSFSSPTAKVDRTDPLAHCFLEELERTVALLAFEDVSNCPVGDLLDISQRLKTASEVNAAILTSQSHEKDPKLPRLMKMLLWAQNHLDEMASYPRITDWSTTTLEDPSL